MARKKKSSHSRVKPKKILKIPVVFDCPFCNGSKSVEVETDFRAKKGLVKCRVCLAKYSVKTHPLMEPIDIFHEWTDSCEALKEEKDKESLISSGGRAMRAKTNFEE